MIGEASADRGGADKLKDRVTLDGNTEAKDPVLLQDLLAITKLLTVFDTYDNENDAVKSFGA